jgi:2'-5' RNA ligase
MAMGLNLDPQGMRFSRCEYHLTLNCYFMVTSETIKELSINTHHTF